VFLRVAGVIFAFAGVVSLITLGNPVALFIAVLGFVMWLAGHWHFALRHHEYKSPLARRIFLQVLPPRYDPTRHWGAPVVPS
jgi:CDP-diglyceride synthetase